MQDGPSDPPFLLESRRQNPCVDGALPVPAGSGLVTRDGVEAKRTPHGHTG